MQVVLVGLGALFLGLAVINWQTGALGLAAYGDTCLFGTTDCFSVYDALLAVIGALLVIAGLAH